MHVTRGTRCGPRALVSLGLLLCATLCLCAACTASRVAPQSLPPDALVGPLATVSPDRVQPVPAIGVPTIQPTGAALRPTSLGGSSSIVESTGVATPAGAAQRTLPAPANAIGRIDIPALGLSVPIVEVSWSLVEIEGQTVGQWNSVSGAAGYHRGSAPLGTRGTCVISGHSRAADGAVLAGLEQLVPGDTILVTTRSGVSRQYAVEALHKLAELGASLAQRRENARFASPGQEDRLVLITCWPDWAYTHRIAVVARPQ